MSLDTTNMLFSLVFLAQRRVPRAKAVAASVGAGMIPGPVGLVLPAIVARGTKPGSGGGGGGTHPPVDTGEIKAQVPDVMGATEEEAVAAVREAQLTPVLSTFPTGNVDDLGRVVGQDPEAGTMRRRRSDVDLTIGRAIEDEDESEDDKEKRILEVVHRIEQKVDECFDNKPRGSKQRERGTQALVPRPTPPMAPPARETDPSKP